MRRRFTDRWPLLAALACHAFCAATASGNVFCAGNDEALWVLWSVVLPDQRHPLVHMGLTTSEPRAFRVPFPNPRLGTVRHLALCGEDLHVVYGEGAHHRYNRRGDFLELTVPEGTVPLAACGDTARDAMYVILPAAPVRRMVPAPAEAVPATQPAFDELSTRLAADIEQQTALLAAHPDARFWIVTYAATRWRALTALPQQFDLRPDHCWMTAHDGDIHLAFRPDEDGQPVLHAVASNDAWSTPAAIPATHAARDGTLLLIDRQAVFVAFLPDQTQPARFNFLPIRAADGQWQVGDKLAGADGVLKTSLRRFAVAGYQHRIAVAVETERPAEPVRVGLWPIEGGKPATPFTPLTAFTPAPKSWLERNWSNTTSFVVLLAIMILLFWRRQDCLLLSARLEPGWSLAGHGRRFVAFVLDMAPAGVVTFPLWNAPLLEAMAAWIQQAQNPGQAADDLAVLQPLWAPWAATRLAYVLYCGLFEAFTAATPGKMAMRCSVRRLDGERPAPRLVLIRNLSRLIELEPLLYIWPMMLLVLMTQNRQRMGDLLARTTVVQQFEPAGPSRQLRPPGPRR